MKYNWQYRVANLMRHYGYDFKEEVIPEVVEMQKEISNLENHSINFEIKAYPDGLWTAQATNVDGLLTGGQKVSEISEMIKDATFTYYGVPSKYANDKLLRNSGEPITTEQNVRVTT